MGEPELNGDHRRWAGCRSFRRWPSTADGMAQRQRRHRRLRRRRRTEGRKAIFLTDTPGVLRDRANPKSLIPQLTERRGPRADRSGVIDGGMVPKVEACFEALEAGAKTALILDGRVPYSLLDVFLHDTFTGTEITR